MEDLYISQSDYAYMKAAIDKAGYREIGFLGIIVQENGINVVKHVEILEQEVSSASVDFDDEGFVKYLERRAANGELPEGDFGIYSAHSHGNMGVYWSSTDEDGIRRYLRGAPWVFSSVFNTKGESKHRLDIGPRGHDVPLVGQISFDEVRLLVVSEPEVAKLEAEIDRLTREIHEDAKAAAEEDYKEFVRHYTYSSGSNSPSKGPVIVSPSITPSLSEGKGKGKDGSAGDAASDADAVTLTEIKASRIKWESKPVLIEVGMGEAAFLMPDSTLVTIDLEDIDPKEVKKAGEEGHLEPDDATKLYEAVNDWLDWNDSYGHIYDAMAWS